MGVVLSPENIIKEMSQFENLEEDYLFLTLKFTISCTNWSKQEIKGAKAIGTNR